MNPGGAWPMAGAVQDMVNSTTFSWYTGARADRSQRRKKTMSSS